MQDARSVNTISTQKLEDFKLSQALAAKKAQHNTQLMKEVKEYHTANWKTEKTFVKRKLDKNTASYSTQKQKIHNKIIIIIARLWIIASPGGVLLIEWIMASAIPISWIPTSEGWNKISGIANRSLFIRIICKQSTQKAI